MANLAQTRKRFQTIATILGAIAAIAALLTFLPLRPSAEEKANELNDAKLRSKALESEVGPLRGLPEKLVQARADIATFHKERFPDRFSAIPEALGEMSSEHGVRLSDVKYETYETELPHIQQVSMEAHLSGDYGDVVRFINALERSKVFFLIDHIALGEEAQSGGDVRLQIRIISVIRTSAAPSTTASAPAAGGRS